MKKARSLVLPASRPPRWKWLAGLGMILVVAAASFALYGLGGSEDPTRPPGPAPEGMVWVPGGQFWMGSDEPMGVDQVSNSNPVHRVWVDGFWMDEAEVTNAQFRAFALATGYRTVAERMPDPALLAKARP